MRTLGERVRKARLEAGLSQAQLGAPHFTRAYVSAIELGKVRPAVKSLEFMAARLGKPASYFMEDEASVVDANARAARIAHAAQLISQGQAGEAIALLRPLLEETVGRPQRASVLRLLGRAHNESGAGAKAFPYLSEALGSFQRRGDREGAARVRVQIAYSLILMLSFAEAATHLDEVLKSFAQGELRDPVLKVQALLNLGIAHYGRGDFTTALQHFERAETESSDIGDPKSLASLFAGIGMSRYQLADFEGSIAYLRKSETLFDSIRNASRVAEIQFQRANALKQLGHRSRALEVARSSAGLAEQLGNERLAVRIWTFAGVCLVELGKHAEAVRALRDLVVRADKTEDAGLRFLARLGLSRALKFDDPDSALATVQESIQILESTDGGAYLADAYSELSDVLSRKGMTKEALEYANKALRVVKPS